MRVNPANSAPIQNSELSSAKKSDKLKTDTYEKQSDAKAAPGKSDSAKAEISTRAKDMAKAKQIAADTSDVREQKIADLKAKIQNKQYNVSAEAIADKLVDDHLKMAGA